MTEVKVAVDILMYLSPKLKRWAIDKKNRISVQYGKFMQATSKFIVFKWRIEIR